MLTVTWTNIRNRHSSPLIPRGTSSRSLGDGSTQAGIPRPLSDVDGHAAALGIWQIASDAVPPIRLWLSGCTEPVTELANPSQRPVRRAVPSRGQQLHRAFAEPVAETGRSADRGDQTCLTSGSPKIETGSAIASRTTAQAQHRRRGLLPPARRSSASDIRATSDRPIGSVALGTRARHEYRDRPQSRRRIVGSEAASSFLGVAVVLESGPLGVVATS